MLSKIKFRKIIFATDFISKTLSLYKILKPFQYQKYCSYVTVIYFKQTLTLKIAYMPLENFVSIYIKNTYPHRRKFGVST